MKNFHNLEKIKKKVLTVISYPKNNLEHQKSNSNYHEVNDIYKQHRKEDFAIKTGRTLEMFQTQLKDESVQLELDKKEALGKVDDHFDSMIEQFRTELEVISQGVGNMLKRFFGDSSFSRMNSNGTYRNEKLLRSIFFNGRRSLAIFTRKR